MLLLFIYLFVALFSSFLCSIMEAALLSVPISYLKAKATNGSKSAARLIRYKEDVDKPLSAILTLNTIAHTVGAAGVGAQATLLFGEAYFGLVSAILTILILVLTEIIPKTIGASYCKNLVRTTARVLRVMVTLLYPIVWISVIITKRLAGREREFTTSREEIAALASIGTEEGIVDDKENKIIQNLFRLKGIKVAEIMTPRTVVEVADEEMSLQEFLHKKEFLYFSRIPVYTDNRDNITGYVFREQVFEKLAEDHFDLRLKDIKRDIIKQAYTTTLFDAWDMLLNQKEHIAIVLDEYGGMDGIVTIEDIIESLLGVEIVDEKDKVEDMQQYALERWKARQKKYEFLQENNS